MPRTSTQPPEWIRVFCTLQSGGALPIDIQEGQSKNLEGGRLTYTPGIDRLFGDHALGACLNIARRSLLQDWEHMDPHDKKMNQDACRTGERIFTWYEHPGPDGDPVKVYCITEADRSTTTILLPEEY